MSTSRSTALATICAATLALAWVAPAQAVTQNFNYTGSEQTFTVPVGVFNMHVMAIGGSGGAGELGGGVAAQVSADLSVTPGRVLYVEVGGKGHNGGGEGGLGGFNGGANSGGTFAGGGGGASDVRTSPMAAGLTPDTRLIVAAGGGGTGDNGETSTGALGGAAGIEGSTTTTGDPGGGAGTATEGGAGGAGFFGAGDDGELGLGGTGGVSEPTGGPGGGGGGGYYGGGGGGGGITSGGGGGGGGSSLIPSGGSSELAPLVTTPPQVQITYNPPPSVAISFPANGATYTRGQAVSAVYSCTPGEGTGLKSCVGPVANGAPLDTSTLGRHTFTVSAEDTDSGAATQSVTYTVAEIVCEVVAGQPEVRAGEPCSGTTQQPPDTVLNSHPKKTVKTEAKKAKVKFTFSSRPAGASFKCKLDKGAFAPCISPKSYKVKLGKHTFSVEAVSSTGTDPMPATFSFKVKKKH